MNYLPRALALLALVGLVIGGKMYLTGFNRDAQVRMERQTGIARIAPQSDYIRAVYDQPLGNAESVSRAVYLLERAGQLEQSRRLERFFEYCNLKRFLEEDIACEGLTVRSAISRAAGLAPSAQWPVDGALAGKVAEALSFSLADEALMRSNTDERAKRDLTYDGPGILRYNAPVSGAYLLLAARNLSPWAIAGFRSRLKLPVPGAQPLDIECGSDLVNPLLQPYSLDPQGAALVYCRRPETLSLQDLMAAVHELRRQDSLTVWTTDLILADPRVALVDEGKPPTHRFTAHMTGAHSGPRVGNPPEPVYRQVSNELAQLGCAQLASCPSIFESASQALFEFFNQALPLIPIVTGLLMGVGIGGLWRRSYLSGAIVATLALVCIIGGLRFAFHSVANVGTEQRGFELLGMSALIYYSAIAFALWLPSMFAGVAIMRPLWRSTETAE